MTDCLFIGLDSFDPDLLAAWSAQGRLPAIASLLASGRSVATTTDPGTFVGSLWATIHTGVNPSRHGLYSWSRIKPGAYEFERTDEREIDEPSFWTRLSAAGVTCAVVDIPHCKLDRGIDGVHVVNWFTHFKTQEGFRTVPEGLAAELERRFGLDPYPSCNAVERTPEGLERFVEALIKRAGDRADFVCELIRSDRYRMVAVGIGESHCVGHQCYDPAADAMDQATILRVYQAIDAAVGRLVEAAGPACEVILLASHGMGPHHDGMHLAERLLRRLDRVAGGARPLPLKNRVMDVVEGSRLRRPLGPLARLLPPPQPRRAYSRVFAVENNTADFGLRVNLKGREPMGVVRPSEYEAFLDDLERRLLSTRRPDGSPAFVRSVRPTRLYGVDPLGNPLPDLMLGWDRSKPFEGLEIPGVARLSGVSGAPRTGDHKEGGLAVLRSSRGHNRERPSVMSSHDIAGEILARFGLAA